MDPSNASGALPGPTPDVNHHLNSLRNSLPALKRKHAEAFELGSQEKEDVYVKSIRKVVGQLHEAGRVALLGVNEVLKVYAGVRAYAAESDAPSTELKLHALKAIDNAVKELKLYRRSAARVASKQDAHQQLQGNTHFKWMIAYKRAQSTRAEADSPFTVHELPGIETLKVMEKFAQTIPHQDAFSLLRRALYERRHGTKRLRHNELQVKLCDFQKVLNIIDRREKWLYSQWPQKSDTIAGVTWIRYDLFGVPELTDVVLDVDWQTIKWTRAGLPAQHRAVSRKCNGQKPVDNTIAKSKHAARSAAKPHSSARISKQSSPARMANFEMINHNPLAFHAANATAKTTAASATHVSFFRAECLLGDLYENTTATVYRLCNEIGMENVDARGYMLISVDGYDQVELPSQIRVTKDRDVVSFSYNNKYSAKGLWMESVTVMGQTAKENGNIELHGITPSTPSVDRSEFEGKESQTELSTAFDKLLSAVETDKPYPYFLVDPSGQELSNGADQKSPANVLQAGSTLLAHGFFPGINTCFYYISQGVNTPAQLHIEDINLNSVNFVLAGEDKIWLIIAAAQRARLENLLRKLKKRAKGAKPDPSIERCSQWVRHYGVLLSCRLLRKYDIEYEIVRQRKGELMFTAKNAYHQVLNTGPNFAISLNCMPDTQEQARDDNGSDNQYKFCVPDHCGKTILTKGAWWRGSKSDTESKDEGDVEDLPAQGETVRSGLVGNIMRLLSS